ncbi:RNA polymerase sigma factor [Catenuloplanes japonicus]|uniref:RNA polymerase sigma factor n=1 Tax=Catenuloplanes japonicus TaxID=33876 RepID=UPI000524F30A|nr:RNA polymerase sigma factor [Catenuloplanes japonicus]
MNDTDADLVRQAQSGDAASLGLLYARHRATMHATALGILRSPADAEDAVHDAALAAIRSITTLRDPEAAGAWLRGIVRRTCFDRLRQRRGTTVGDDVLRDLADARWDPEQRVERLAQRDWVWHALEQLTPPLRLVTLLRYFSGLTAYQSIAEVCDLPVGTVRSRLHEARSKLSAALLATADAAHADSTAIALARRRQAQDVLDAAMQGRFAAAIADFYAPAVDSFWPGGRHRRGTEYLVRAMNSDLSDGVRRRLVDVVAGSDVLIWEEELINPADDPFHCPPGAVWVQTLAGARVHELRIYHHPRSNFSAPARYL